MNYKILALSYLFPNKYFPFYGIFVLNRLNAVHKYCEVKVIAPIPWFPFMEKFRKFKNYTKIPKHEVIEELEVYHPKFLIVPGYLKWFDSISYLFSVIPSVLRIRKEFRFDIIDVHWVYPDILAGYVFSVLFRKKLIVTIRGKEAICFGERSLRKKIIDYLLKKAHIVVVLSSELKDIVKEIGVEHSKINVIQNGVDVGRFLLKEREECRKRLGMGIESKMIL
ncbi:MAG: glycosyltransferase, partial [Planctomycetota bacterium]